jgi:hypothetical protein
MLFMQTQQTQPALVMPIMQSQHAWIMAQQDGSPLVQVMQTPSVVGSHLHIAMAMLQQHIIMPFMIMQQLHMPPAIIEQRFWSIVADMASSHLHVIFMPPVHFSIVILHRGTIIHCGAGGIPAAVPIGPAPAVPIPGIPIPARSIIIAVVIADSSPGVQLREFVTTHFRVASSRCASLCLHTTQIQYQLPKIFRHKQTILLGIVRINGPIRGRACQTPLVVLTILESTPFVPTKPHSLHASKSLGNCKSVVNGGICIVSGLRVTMASRNDVYDDWPLRGPFYQRVMTFHRTRFRPKKVEVR